jgi:hypothetical protein
MLELERHDLVSLTAAMLTRWFQVSDSKVAGEMAIGMLISVPQGT